MRVKGLLKRGLSKRGFTKKNVHDNEEQQDQSMEDFYEQVHKNVSASQAAASEELHVDSDEPYFVNGCAQVVVEGKEEEEEEEDMPEDEMELFYDQLRKNVESSAVVTDKHSQRQFDIDEPYFVNGHAQVEEQEGDDDDDDDDEEEEEDDDDDNDDIEKALCMGAHALEDKSWDEYEIGQEAEGTAEQEKWVNGPYRQEAEENPTPLPPQPPQGDKTLIKKKLKKVQKMLKDIAEEQGKESKDYQKWIKKAREYANLLGILLPEDAPDGSDPIALAAWKAQEKIKRFEQMGAEEVTQVTKKTVSRRQCQSNIVPR